MIAAALSGYYKCGSSWRLTLARKNPDGTPVDLTGLDARAMFRAGSAEGPVLLTLDDAEAGGITIDDPGAVGYPHRIVLDLTRDQTALFAPGVSVVFDVELTSAALPEYEWQSQTYRIRPVQQVTRDDE